MIMKQGFVRGAVSGGLLGLLAGVAVMAAPAGAEDMAVKINNFNFAPQRITVKAGTTVTWTNADNIPHAIASTTKVLKSKVLDTEYDTGVICETQKQAERLAVLVETVAFVRGASLATARSRADTFAVVEILVVGVDLGSGFQSIPPGAYFMLVKIDERNA